MSYIDVMKVIPTIESAALAEDNIKFLKKKKKSFVKQGVKNIVGTALIKETAQI